MRKKVVGGTVLGLVVFALGAVWVYELLTRESGEYESVIRCYFPLQRKLGEVRLLLERQRALIEMVMVHPDPALRAEFDELSARLRRALADSPEMAAWPAGPGGDRTMAALAREFESVHEACAHCAGLHEQLFTDLVEKREARAQATLAELARRVVELRAIMQGFEQSVALQTHEAEVRASAARSRLLRVFVAGVVAALVLGTFFNVGVYRLLLPLKRMVDAVRQVARGDYSVRLPVSGKDELSYLSAEFNGMTAALAEHVRALEQSQEVIRATFDGIDDVLVVHDVQGTLLHANPSAWALAAQRDQAAPACYRRVLDLGDACQAVDSTAGLAGLLVVRDPHSGSSYEVSRQAVRDGEGRVRFVVEFIRDITEKLQAEQQLRQSEKLSAIGRVAMGVAHEVRNPLSTIQMTLHSLGKKADLRPSERERVDLAQTEVGRLEGLVSSLLRYGRPVSPELHVVEVEDLLRHSLELIGAESAKRQVEVVLEEPLPELPPIDGDPHQLIQVLLNLYENAVQASRPGAAVRVTAAFQAGWHNRGAVTIAVSDAGHGIDARNLGEVFTPFFTTRNEGTGLGLPIALKIVESHGGELALDSEPGRGTTARLTLPARGPEGWPAPRAGQVSVA